MFGSFSFLQTHNCVILFEKMASPHEHPNNSRYTRCANNSTFASEIRVRRHVDLSSSFNNSVEQTIVLKSRKSNKPLDYLIWSSMLVISGMLIFGFVTVILLFAVYKSMWKVKDWKNADILLDVLSLSYEQLCVFAFDWLYNWYQIT
jgi:hypothetical protein